MVEYSSASPPIPTDNKQPPTANQPHFSPTATNAERIPQCGSPAHLAHKAVRSPDFVGWATHMIPDRIVKLSQFARLATRVLPGGKGKLVVSLFHGDRFFSRSKVCRGS
ncbi:hypothetical protein NIES2130_28295 [Scytonema sp. HK-05]|nr:hypothetical protein NIES2130_28295 [Scytonema sp. HK-05]